MKTKKVFKPTPKFVKPVLTGSFGDTIMRTMPESPLIRNCPICGAAKGEKCTSLETETVMEKSVHMTRANPESATYYQ